MMAGSVDGDLVEPELELLGRGLVFGPAEPAAW